MQKIMVTGASGQLGRRVLHHLLHTVKLPIQNVVAATRKPAALNDWAQLGMEVRSLDLDAYASAEAAFQGIDRVLLISTDAIGRRAAQHVTAIRAAQAAGVVHLAYTSMPLPEGSPVLFAPEHEATEAAIKSSSLPGWTILRNHWYFENLLASAVPALQSGMWFSAAGDGRVAHIARDDLARAAAYAVSRTEQGKNTYTLSGSKAYNTAEIVQLVAAAAGQSIALVPATVEQLAAGMVAAGLPESVAKAYASFDTNTAQGRVAQVTTDYEKLTGVQPLSFDAWLDAHQAYLKG
ncbi:SDR family oxidoreductase [Curvibacter sp. CHRR-16]|uniref:SDR family oxidoreductase n=1 Tax=Curvibacter sp. CHRR-16 TaxID=2835872 RepID=UPI001BD938CE|nr:SDR family oxidoreductase [Curvibacter sp. CHRR-16]MBT0570871.1 SDR family oxidoreductase [Curvibacter sp. CHRR-16]